MELYPGATIAGRYRVDRRIGAGGMGEVWAGEHVGIGVRVAVKTLLPAAALDPHVVARFRREAQLLGRLRSERVARIVDFVEDRDFGLVLVMEFVEGEVLGAVLATRRLSVEECLTLGVDLASALGDLHRAKVVHRDLKPDNVILEPVAGGRRRAVIVDLGVGRLDASGVGDDSVTSLTQADMAVGTLSYMAPEQLLSSSTATAAADVYALGAILYRAVSGEHVFGDADEALAARNKLAGEAPPLAIGRVDRVATGLASVVARTLRRDPNRRSTAAEVHAELAVLANEARVTALDLEAPTELALPAELDAQVGSESAEAVTTTRMSRPPADLDPIADEATTVSPASQALPRASEEPLVVLSSGRRAEPLSASQGARTTESNVLAPPDPLTATSIHQTRPTVHSPMLAPTPAEPLARAERPSHEPPKLAMVSRRALVLAVMAALVGGAAVGFAAGQKTPPPVSHPRP